MDPLLWCGVGVLGGLGALARFALDAAVSARSDSAFPFGTLTVNLCGTFCFGVLLGAGLSDDGLRLVGIGLIGSFTTFSTWMLETARLAEEGDDRLAVLNVVLSLLLGVALAWLGSEVGSAL